MDHFVEYDEVQKAISKGSTRSTVRLRSGLSADLRVVPAVSYGSASIDFTGSRAHNIALRKIAVDQGCKVNKYGVFEGKSALPAAPNQRSTTSSGSSLCRRNYARITVKSGRQGRAGWSASTSSVATSCSTRVLRMNLSGDALSDEFFVGAMRQVSGAVIRTLGILATSRLSTMRSWP
ncbi:MAG: hypothetical protein LJE91_09615 [Gammaproteobacteria bacterium]|jgi:hypothetical protein|nr:hypothetical protein [Gammaproteobacteria bacterium]